MRWSERICFEQPVSQVSLVTGAPAENWDEIVRAREAAAYQRGQQDCQAALRQQASERDAEQTQRQRSIIESLSDVLPQLVREGESALIDLALEAARRVVAGTAIDAQMVEAVVREALRQAQDTAEILVQLHPDDLALLREKDAEILKGVPDKGPLRFMPTGEVSRGGCLVQTRFGMVDDRREVKLEQLAQSLGT